MRLLLLNPPNPADLQANRDYMGNFGMLNTRPGVVLPPLHLIQMGGTIPADQFDFLDAAAENLNGDEVKHRFREKSYTHVIVLTSTPTSDLDYETARWMKENSKALVYLYGPHPAHVAKEAFKKSGADGILVGYTPTTLSTLVNHTSPPKMEELMLPDSIKTPPPIAPSFKMDDLPFGCWGKTPLHRYRFHVHEPTPFVTMRSSLGCIYACAYCPYVLAEGQRFLPMSPQRTYDEMSFLQRDFGVRLILFRDLLFTAQKRRIEDLCTLLRNKPIDLVWRAETSTQHLTRDLVYQMYLAGCRGLNLGLETVDEKCADEMALSSKRRNLDHAVDIVRYAENLGIRVNAMFVIGFPEDSAEGIERTIKFAAALGANTCHFQFAMPFPGTELERIVKKENLIEATSWSDYTSIRPVMRTRYLSLSQVQEYGRKALRDVYIQPGRLLRMALNPVAFVRRAHAFLRYYVGH